MSRLSGPLWMVLHHTLLQTVTGLPYLCLSFQADCKHPLNICLVTLRRPKSHQKLSDGINLPLLLSLFIHFSQSLSQHFKTPKTRLISLSSSRWYNLLSLRECLYAMFHNISVLLQSPYCHVMAYLSCLKRESHSNNFQNNVVCKDPFKAKVKFS